MNKRKKRKLIFRGKLTIFLRIGAAGKINMMIFDVMENINDARMSQFSEKGTWKEMGRMSLG